MSNKVDIVPAREGQGYEVWARHDAAGREVAPTGYDDGYEGKPLYGPAEEDACLDWCAEHEYEYRHRKQAMAIPERFRRDVERRCDEWRTWLDRFAADCGRRLASDIHYRASAAWKEEPTHYCYHGDCGTSAKLERIDKDKGDAEDLMQAQMFLDYLLGAAVALWELGLVLTYGEDGKHRIYGQHPQWVTVKEDEDRDAQNW